jgi:hypothetical protein
MTDDGEGYRVYMVKLPGDVRGAVRLDEEGFASIYINDDLSPEEKQKVFRHEIRHIRRGDHFSPAAIRQVESS